MPQAYTFTVVPRLTQIAMAVRPEGLIADEILPRIPVPAEYFEYTKATLAESFTIPDLKVGRTGKPNQIEFSSTDVTDSTQDYALDTPVANKDLEVAAAAGVNYDPLGLATESVTGLVLLGREKRVADLLTTLGTYNSSLRTTLSGMSQWSDTANSDPIRAIKAVFDTMLIRPNIGFMGREVFTQLSMHPKVVASVLGRLGTGAVAAASGEVTAQQLADALGLERILVGDAFANTAKFGQTASYGRLWGKHAGFLRINRSVTSVRGFAIPTFGFTAQFGNKIAGTIVDPDIGAKGGVRVRSGELVKELVSWPEAGCFFQNAVG